MLWYKDRKQYKLSQKLVEGVAYGLAIAAIGFTVGYSYQALVNLIGRHCTW